MLSLSFKEVILSVVKYPGWNRSYSKLVFEIRDTKSGKSAGYRIIYEVNPDGDVLLIAIYAKPDQSSINSARIKEVIDEEAKPI